MADDNSQNQSGVSATSAPAVASTVPASQAQPAAAAPAGTAVKPTAGSPWDEELDIPDNKQSGKPSIIGSLDGSASSEGINNEAPFAVPKDVEEVVGKKLPAEQFIPKPAENTAPKDGVSALISNPSAPGQITPNTVVNPPAPSVAPAQNVASSQVSIAGQAEPAPAEEAALEGDALLDEIFSTPANLSDSSGATLPVNSSVARPVDGLKAVNPVNPPAGQSQVLPPQPTSASAISVAAEPVSTLSPAQPEMGGDALINSLKNKIKEAPVQSEQGIKPTTTEYVAEKLGQTTKNTQKTSLVQKINPLNVLRGERSGRLKKILLVATAPILIIGGLVALTEMGYFSLHLENVYGAIGIEQLWGGLPKSTEGALVRSAIEMQNHPNYKVKGKLTLTVDRSTQSPVTAPLLSMSDEAAQNIASIFPPLKIITAATTTGSSVSAWDDIYSTSIDDTYSSSSSSTGTSNTSVSSAASGTTADNTSSLTGDTSSSQNDYPSYQYQGASVKDIPITIDATFGQSGSDASLKVNKVTGDAEIALKSTSDKLWLKSDSSIKYSSTVKSNQWLEYNLAPLKNKVVQKDFFNFVTSAGMSVKGTRLANEKIEKTRTYHYKIDSFEIGSALAPIGINSNMVQNVSGDVWIGVKDKLIKKVNLKITPALSSSATAIVFEATFYDYNIATAFVQPDSNLIVKGDGGASLSGDVRRKNDLAKIATALEEYKTANSKYPVATTLQKLTSSSNLLTQELIPDYLAALPTDPKASDGWYYAYKSDGTTFSLSARVEDTDDSEAQKIGDVYLYLLYSK